MNSFEESSREMIITFTRNVNVEQSRLLIRMMWSTYCKSTCASRGIVYAIHAESTYRKDTYVPEFPVTELITARVYTAPMLPGPLYSRFKFPISYPCLCLPRSNLILVSHYFGLPVFRQFVPFLHKKMEDDAPPQDLQVPDIAQVILIADSCLVSPDCSITTSIYWLSVRSFPPSASTSLDY